MLRVLARAESSGYMVSRILTEFSWGMPGEELIAFIAEGGSLPGTGTACFGVAAQNCNGEDWILLFLVMSDGDGVASNEDLCSSPSDSGDISGGIGVSRSGETKSSIGEGEGKDDLLHVDMGGEIHFRNLGGVASSGGSSGRRGGPISVLTLLIESGECFIEVEVSAVANTGGVVWLGSFSFCLAFVFCTEAECCHL